MTKYIGGIYEEVIQGGITQKIHYLGDFALFVQKGGATATSKHEYIHRDHIGSVVAITGTTLNSSADAQWQARGGDATLDNAQLACPHCNASKGAGVFPKTPPSDYVGPWPPKHW